MKTTDFLLGEALGEDLYFYFNETFDTSLGPLRVVVCTTREPNEEDIVRAKGLLSHFQAHEDEARRLLYAEYRKSDPAWLKRTKVAVDLTEESFVAFVEDVELRVGQEEADGEDDDSNLRLYARPQWDEEHCFYLSPTEDGWQREDY